MAARKKGTCAYCGRYGRVTMDHVPPRNLFALPRPALITVPACSLCHNDRTKLDDEYFRNVLVMREDVFGHPDAFAGWMAMARSYWGPAQSGLARAIDQAISLKETYYSPTQLIYTGQRPAMTVDLRRLDRVIDRITRGLFYHEHRRQLTAAVVSLSRDELEAFEQRDPTAFLRFVEATRAALQGAPVRTIGNSVFSYKFLIAIPEQQVGAWAYLFYRRVFFLSLTGQRPAQTQSTTDSSRGG